MATIRISLERRPTDQWRFRYAPDENVCALVLSSSTDDDRFRAYAVALRRTLLEEVPYPALGPQLAADTQFVQNTTMFNDEYIRLRVGMVPLSLKPGYAERRAAGPDVFVWPRGPVPRFSLIADGAAAHELVSATAESLRPSDDAETGVAVLPDPVTNAHSLVAKLLPSQHLDMKTRVVIASGRDHAAHSALGTVSYEVVDASPGAGAAAAAAAAAATTATVRMVVEANNAAPPTAQQHVYDALYWALRRQKDLSAKLDPGAAGVSVDARMDPPAVSVVVDGETEARATVVTAELRSGFMDGGSASPPRLAFAAHRVPHPLEHRVEFRVQPTMTEAQTHELSADRPKELKEWGVGVLREAVKAAVAQYGNLLHEWSHEADGDMNRPTIADRVH